MSKRVDKKLKIENLTRCMNCNRFVTCSEKEKENIVDCLRYREVGRGNQVVAVRLER
jgi:hypothetical protein